MTYIKIETLTPVHVGSGRQFQGNFEYLYFPAEKQVAIIDEYKVLNIIGVENLDKWLAVINQEGSLLEYLQQRRLGIKAPDAALRILQVPGKAPSGKNTIREFIHTGTGNPILPGSSLKGSIRTALFTQKLLSQPQLVQEAGGLKNRKSKFDDEALDKEIFGEDPNHDLLKLLRISDVSFDETVCLLSETLNLKHNGYDMKPEVRQFTECLPANSIGLGRIQVPKQLIREIEKRHFIRKDMAVLQVPALFALINQHTMRLLKKELEFWQDQQLPQEAELFVETLQHLADTIATLKPNACILRVGFGAGYNFMTGGWQQDLLSAQTFTEVANAARRRDYSNAPFPKSRKMMLNGLPMGFIKISALSTDAYEIARQEKEQAQTQKAEKLQLAIVRQQEEQAAAEKNRLQQQADALQQAEDAKKPVRYTGRLKAGVQLDAELVKVDLGNPKIKTFKLLAGEPGQEQLVNLSYTSPLALGLIAVVKIVAESKGKVQSIQFMRDKSK